MRVFLKPTGLHSRAMVRVTAALEQHAPSTVSVAGSPSPLYCDAVVIHAIGADAIELADGYKRQGLQYVIIQYCLISAGGILDEWRRVWAGAALVWSYYDLTTYGIGDNFYFAPLGVDEAFKRPLDPGIAREPLVVTTGHVTGPGAEAIEEVWVAAGRVGLKAIHIGPAQIEGIHTYPDGWNAVQDISDEELAAIYRRASWVAGLRHVEGFELPAAEGLCCGAKAIVFQQPTMFRWYSDFRVEFVPDIQGSRLVNRIASLFADETCAYQISEPERKEICERFDWSDIATDFWSILKFWTDNVC